MSVYWSRWLFKLHLDKYTVCVYLVWVPNRWAVRHRGKVSVLWGKIIIQWRWMMMTGDEWWWMMMKNDEWSMMMNGDDDEWCGRFWNMMNDYDLLGLLDLRVPGGTISGIAISVHLPKTSSELPPNHSKSSELPRNQPQNFCTFLNKNYLTYCPSPSKPLPSTSGTGVLYLWGGCLRISTPGWGPSTITGRRKP